MKYKLFCSIEAMLDPQTLSELVSETITEVSTTPAGDLGGNSGSPLTIIETNHGQGTRYMLKRISREWDHLMRTTNDIQGRTPSLWKEGILDQLPNEMAHPVIACSVEGNGWAILMQDVSLHLLHQGDCLSSEDNETILKVLAALHATFWEKPYLHDRENGLATIDDYFLFVGIEHVRREAKVADISNYALQGWKRVREVADADVVDIAMDLLENPKPLVNALRRYPSTLIHGDYWINNLGLCHQPEKQIILIDWGLSAVAPPSIDLVWYLVTCLSPKKTITNDQKLATIVPHSWDEMIALYKTSLQKRLGENFDEAWWQPQLDLGLMVGFLRLGWIYPAMIVDPEHEKMRPYWEESLVWWSEKLRIGTKHLKGS